ncbi:Bni4 protein [Saccharomycopsis crataegensis]|uniref:Bni4 protein n=1 Tax=Saccharomycopsis crataegensis TaxID=43959 RepID=A0AAV5QG05_9ASCO|nr:Bni4 protein [Saccharomycopsis crataegensis]
MTSVSAATPLQEHHHPSSSDQPSSDEILFDTSQSFAKGIRDQLKNHPRSPPSGSFSSSTCSLSNEKSNDPALLKITSNSSFTSHHKTTSIVSADQLSFKTANEEDHQHSVDNTIKESSSTTSENNHDKSSKDPQQNNKSTPPSTKDSKPSFTLSNSSIKRSGSLIGVSTASISVAAAVATTTTTNAIGTLSRNDSTAKEVVTAAKNHQRQQSSASEFTEDFGKVADQKWKRKPPATVYKEEDDEEEAKKPSSAPPVAVIQKSNLQPTIPKIATAPSTTTTTSPTKSSAKINRRSFFGFGNKPTQTSISDPVLITDNSNISDSKLQVPEALQTIQQQQKQLFGDVPKNYIPTQNQNTPSATTIDNSSNNTTPKNKNTNANLSVNDTPTKSKRFSRLPSRKPSSASLFTTYTASSNTSTANNNNTHSSSALQPAKKSSSLKSFFKYKKSMSTNNLNSSLRANQQPSSNHLKSASNLDLHAAYRNGQSNGYGGDSYSMMSLSMDSRSISSNATTRTSISTFKKQILNKFRSKNNTQSSGSSVFTFKKNSNDSRKSRVDNTDATSIRTSNTANFNYAISNMAKQNQENNSNNEPSIVINGVDDSGFCTPKKTSGSVNESFGDSTIKRDMTSPLSTGSEDTSKKPSVSIPADLSGTADNEVTTESLLSPELKNFDEGDILFPKSLDLKEVNNIVSIERKLSTKRADSVRKNRNSIEVKAKEGGMTVEIGKEVNEPNAGGLKKTNSILKKKATGKEKDLENDVIQEVSKEDSFAEDKIETPNGDSAIKDDAKNFEPPASLAVTGSHSKHSSTSSTSDFGIKFEDSNLDLDFTDFQQNGSVYTTDDVSSRSFESNDESERNLRAVNRNEIITAASKQQELNEKLNRAKVPGINTGSSNLAKNVPTSNNNYTKVVNDQSATAPVNPGAKKPPTQANGKSKGGFINSFKNIYNRSSENVNKAASSPPSSSSSPPPASQAHRPQPPTIEVTDTNNRYQQQQQQQQSPSTPPNKKRYSHRSTLSSGSTVSSHSQHQYGHRRNNLSSNSFNSIVGASQSSPASSGQSRRLGNHPYGARSNNSSNIYLGNNGGSHRVKFSSRIILYETYNADDYDRHPEIATCNQLTPLLAQQIREELNTFKAQMPIHDESRCYTHFF